MKKENSLIRCQSEQRTREVCHLEEELGKVKVSLSKSQNFAEEMKGECSIFRVVCVYMCHGVCVCVCVCVSV